MSAIAPVDAASCRAMAQLSAKRVKEYIALRQYPEARKELDRARDMTLLALKFEQEENSSRIAAVNGGQEPTDDAVQSGDKSTAPYPHLPSGAAACSADSPAGSTSSPIQSGTNPQSDSDAISEVKGIARPENAAGVEPSLSEPHSLRTVQTLAADTPEGGPLSLSGEPIIVMTHEGIRS